MALNIRDLPEIDSVLSVSGNPQFVVIRFDRFRKFIQKLQIAGQIDEQDYLKRHPDVAKAVAERKIPNCTDHYLKTGYAEKRDVKLPPIQQQPVPPIQQQPTARAPTRL